MSKHPGYSAIKITGLSIGLLCFITIMLWVRYEMSFDKFNIHSEDLYQVIFTNESHDYNGVWQVGALAGYLKENYPEIIESTSFSEMQFKISRENIGFYGTGSYVDSSFFKMFTFPMIYGNPDNSLRQPNSIVLTRSLSKKLFGKENSIGEAVKLNENMIYSVTGIIEDVPENSHMNFDFLIPFSDVHDEMKSWNSKWTSAYILLDKKANVDEVNIKIAQVMDIFQPSWKNILYLEPLEKIHLHALNGRGLIVYIILFSSMAIVIILLACVNFMNLSTARSELRQKEIFIKKVSGSKRSQLAWQFMTESVIFTFIALIVSILLTILLLPFINNLFQTNLSIYNFSLIPWLLILALITGIIAGSYPAIYLSSLIPGRLAKGKLQSHGNRKWNLRYILVISQFTISIFFIVAMLSIKRQLNFIKSKDLGFNQENIINLTSIGSLSQNSKEFKAALLQNPAIESVTVSNNDMTSWKNSGGIDWNGRDKESMVEIAYNWVDYDFLKAFDLEMSRGRFFSENFLTDREDAIILNEKAVDYLNLDNPVGMKVKTWFGFEGTVIGVIKDFHSSSLREDITPCALLLSEYGSEIFIKTNNSANNRAVLQFIGEKLKQIVPDDPFEYKFLKDQIQSLYKTEVLTSKITGIATLLAIFISCLGLFGLVMSIVERKIKEIGIRKTNGAKTGEVMFMLVKDFTIHVFIAFLIASPVAYFAIHKWLENFAYKTTLTWWIFALAGLLALGIALLTVSWQSWRAATRNPVEALRYE